MPNCNENTAHVPIQVLRRLAKIDIETTKTIITPLLASDLLKIFENYHRDAMLADDILELIKVFADIP